jgi:hypothetical protein
MTEWRTKWRVRVWNERTRSWKLVREFDSKEEAEAWIDAQKHAPVPALYQASGWNYRLRVKEAK